ncbi:SfiI-subtelomeric fragment related protein family member, putative [Theileria annulata]|uniref:SfiI-subtelomeric related protein family member, putative n=1 Tax=Theileria annulata TaxID=5874 RepID=Q4UCL8_THEAN|nr:SfiI-subtelomeric fragment related protein family member, putative [Theileria annulata]CAI75433.1 SfiI-subtelomeric fragment related protein family member, putative [Theileria annulata]
MFSLFELVGSDWKDITKDRYDVSKLKFFGDNDNELKSSDYSVTIFFLSYEFTFNSDVKCKKIMLAHDDVWKHDDYTEFADIKSFSLGLTSNNFFVKNQSDKSKKVDFKPTAVKTPTKVTVDLNATQSTNEFDYTDDNGVVTFKPKDNNVINKLVQGTTDIWEAKNDVNGILVRIKVSKGVKFLVVLLDNNKFTVFNLEGNEWKDVTSMRHDVTKLKFFGDNDFELKSSDYSVTIVDLSFAHIFNNEINCKKIKLGDDELWKHTDDPKFESIKSFSLGLASNSFFAKNQSNELKKIERGLEPEAMVTPTIASQVSAPLASSVSRPKGNPVGVDIENKQSTNEFDYTDDNGVVTYTPKSGNVFDKVVDGVKDVWQSKDDVNGTLVRIKVTKNIKYLAVLLDNNMFTLFHLENNEWKDITSQRYDVSKLKFFGENDTEITSSNYTVNIVFLTYEFTFNSGVKCKKIMLAHDDVWKHTDDSNYSDIKSFSLGLSSNAFFVKNQSDQSKKVDFTPTQAKATPVTKEESMVTPTIVSQVSTPLTSSVSTPKGTPVSLDIEKTQSTTEFEYTDKDGVVTYKVKSGHVFNKVTKGTTVIWDSKDVFGSLVRTMTINGVKYVAILLDNNMFKLFKQEGNEWTDITSNSHDITKLKFFGDNDTELKSSDYKVDLVDLSYTYTFNDGINCRKVKLGDNEVWKHTDDTKFSEIKSFRLGLVSNTFYVLNDKNESKKIDFKPTQATAELVSPTSVQQTSLAILAEPAPPKAAVTVIAPTGRPRPKKTPEVAAGPRTAITLDIGDKASNSAIDFKEDYLKNVMVFSAMDKYVFNKIVKTSRSSCCGSNCCGSNCCGSNCCESETVIWEAKNESEHFHTVYVDGLGTCSSTKNLSLHLCNGTFKHLKESESGPWTPYPGVADLDVKISNSNIQVDYFKKDNYRIYVAKPGYTIRKVMKKDASIWTAQNEHALKVVLMGSKKETKHLSILLKSGGLTLLFKGGKDQPWQNITSSKNKITDLKMYAMADDKSVELHKGHYSITLFNEFYGYLFYEGVGCVKVTHNGKNIWDLSEEGDFGCLKGVFLDLKSNKFNVMNDDDRCWVCEQVRKVNPVILDISSKASTDDFDFTVDHNRNINIYTSKGNAMFYQVIKTSGSNCCGSTCCGSETVIWETNDSKKYATKVFADGVGMCSSTKNVSIYLLNGDILHFGKGGRNEPWKPSDNKITLDVDKTSSTIGYDFVHHGETRTFTAKPGYQFKTVMLSSSWTWLVCGSSCCKSGCLSDHIFWEAQTDEECSTKVTVYGVKTTVTNINIFLKNNQVKHYHKVDGEWVTETSIVLNIDVNTDNDLFEYRSTRNFGHFNPKANLTIEKIVKTYKSNCCVSTCCGRTSCGSIDEVVIWSAKPEDHGLKAVLMGSSWGEKHLSILLQSGNFVLLRKVFRNYPWKDITKEKSDFSDIKMYSLDEGTSNYRELTETDYDPIIFESRYGYEFNDGIKCVKITYNDKLLWSHTDDPEYGYLKGLYLDLPKNQFIVTNLKDQTKEVYITFALDIKKTEGTREFYYFKDDDCQKYSAKSGHVFNKIVDGTKVIWQSSDNVFANLARSKSREDGKYLAILLTNRMFKLFKEEDNKWKDITSQRSDITKLTFLGDKDAELTSSDYTVTIADYSYQFKFNDGVKCKKVMYGDDDVWKPSDDPEYSEIKSFSLGLCSNSFIVKNQSDELKKITKSNVALDINNTESTNDFEHSESHDFHKYTAKSFRVFSKVVQGTKDIWVSNDDVYGTSVGVRTKDEQNYVVVLLDNSSFKLFQESGGNWTDITSGRFDVTMLKFLGENDDDLTSSNYTVELLGHRSSFTISYLFNRGPKCKTVMYGNDIVYDKNSFSCYKTINRFDFNPVSNTLYAVKNSCDWRTIDFKPPTTKGAPVTKPAETKPAGTTAVEAKTVTLTSAASTPTKVTVDISKNESTNEFEYTDESGVVTFKPKDNHVFDKISDGTKLIWESKESVFGTLVRIKVTKGVKYLAILLDNHMFTLFHEESGEWKDITSKRYDVSKLKFFGESDTELKSSDYSVNIVFLSYEFTFNTGVKCKKIKLAHDDVWKDTDDSNYSDIKSFSLGLSSNTFFVKNQSDKSKKLEFKPTEVTKVTLDIQNTQSSNEFDYTDDNGVVTYKVKSYHVFSKITQGTTDIWEAKDDVNGTLVRTKVSKGVKYLVVLLTNNMFTVFQEDAGEWKDVTSKRHDVTKLKFFDESDRELSKNDYEVSIVDLSFAYIFNSGVSCKKIMLGDDELWKHTDDTNFAEIKSFSLGLASNSFFVKNQSDQLKKIERALEAKPVEAKVTPTIAPVTATVSTPLTSAVTTPTKVTADISKTQTTNEFEYTDESGVVTYKPKDGNVFDKIVEGSTVIWESKTDVFGTLVRIKVTKGVKYLAILLDNHMFTLFHEESGEWKDITSKRYDVSKLKFFGESDTELKSSDYSVNIVFLSYEFTFNTGVKCKKIKLAHDDVWKDTDDSNYSDIKSFSLGLSSNTFFVKNQSDKSKKLEFKPTETKATQVTKEQTETEPVEAMVTAKSAPVTSAVSNPKATPSTDTGTKTPAVTPVAVDVSKTQTTNELDYSKDGDCEKYTPKDNHAFNKVVDGNTAVWESKDDIRCALVRTKSKDYGKYLAMLLTDNSFKLFKQEAGKNKPWTEITNKRHDVSKLKFLGDNDTELKSSDYTVTIVDYSYEFTLKAGIKCMKIKLGDEDVWKHDDDPKFSEITKFQLGLISNSFFVVNNKSESKKLDFNQTDAKATPITTPSKVSVDVDKTQSTNEFQYSMDASGFVTYTPKTGNVFNKVLNKNTVIWESKDDICGTLVMSKTEKENVHLAILLQNYSFVLVHSSDKGKNWTNITTQRHDVKKLKFLDDNDTEIKASDYKVKLVDLSYQYTFNTGVKCKKIKLGDEELWKHTDDTKFATITMFHLGLISNNFFVKNSSEFKKLEFKSTQAKSTPPATPAVKPAGTTGTQPKAVPTTKPTPAAKPAEQAKPAQTQAKPEAKPAESAKAAPTTPAAKSTQAQPEAKTSQAEPAKPAQTQAQAAGTTAAQAKATPAAKPEVKQSEAKPEAKPTGTQAKPPAKPAGQPKKPSAK